jgi:hypothetical protein
LKVQELFKRIRNESVAQITVQKVEDYTEDIARERNELQQEGCE